MGTWVEQRHAHRINEWLTKRPTDLPVLDLGATTKTPVVAAVLLDPVGLDFIIDNLPREDGATKELVRLRDEAQKYLWRELQ